MNDTILSDALVRNEGGRDEARALYSYPVLTNGVDFSQE